MSLGELIVNYRAKRSEAARLMAVINQQGIDPRNDPTYRRAALTRSSAATELADYVVDKL